MNQINLIGRITKKPELRYTTSNKAVCEFSLAVNRIGQDQADFITCTVWGNQAENLCKYQDKGSLIAVSGELRVDKYQDQDGNNRYKTYVLANNVEYLQSKKESSPATQLANKDETPESDPFIDFANEVVVTDDMLPF